MPVRRGWVRWVRTNPPLRSQLHRLRVVKVAHPLHHCLCTANPNAQTILQRPKEQRLVIYPDGRDSGAYLSPFWYFCELSVPHSGVVMRTVDRCHWMHAAFQQLHSANRRHINNHYVIYALESEVKLRSVLVTNKHKQRKSNKNQQYI